MAARTSNKIAEEEAPKGDPVDEIWAKLQTENHIPPLEFAGLSLTEPTKRQIDAWRVAQNVEDGERALFGDKFDAVHAVFADQPLHVWENFNGLYLKHFFGTTGDEELKG